MKLFSQHKSSTEKVTFSITFLFFALGIGILGFFLLTASNDSGEFTQTLIFLLIFIASYEILLGTGFAGVTGNGQNNKDSLKYFFAQSPTLSDLKWIPIGLGSIWVVSQVASNVESPLFAIFISGLILSITLIRTNAILIPIIIHGTWNSYVFLSGLTTSPFIVPKIGLSTDTWTQVFFQYFLTSNAEEMMRVVIIVLVVVTLSKNTRFSRKNPIVLGIAVIVSVIAWTGYHTIVAQPIA